jgi:hypothetical protein
MKVDPIAEPGPFPPKPPGLSFLGDSAICGIAAAQRPVVTGESFRRRPWKADTGGESLSVSSDLRQPGPGIGGLFVALHGGTSNSKLKLLLGAGAA